MNMQALMQQAKKMEKDIKNKKEEIDKKIFVGSSELVEVTMTGAKTVTKVNIKMDELSTDDKEILEDMITLAVNDCIDKINEETDRVMGAYGSQLNGLF